MHKGDGFSAKPLGKSLFHCQNVWSGHGPAGQFWLLESALIESKRKWLKNSRDQLDFLEVPYLLIVLLYNISSIISFLLILYIVVTRKQESIFLNQVWLNMGRLQLINLTKNELNHTGYYMKYTSVLRLLVTIKSLFFNCLIAVTGHLKRNFKCILTIWHLSGMGSS